MRLKLSISEPERRSSSLRVRQRFGTLMIPTLKKIQKIQKGEVEVLFFYLSHAFHEVVFKHPKACLCLWEFLHSIDNLRLHMRIFRLWASIHREIHPQESRRRNQIYFANPSPLAWHTLIHLCIHPSWLIQKKSDRRRHIYADRSHFVPSSLPKAMETHRQEKGGKTKFLKSNFKGYSFSNFQNTIGGYFGNFQNTLQGYFHDSRKYNWTGFSIIARITIQK